MSYNRELIYQAKQLRKNMTAEERRLWFDYLAKCSAKFTPQKVIENYIVDFYSYEAKLVIELDGEHHQASAEKKREDKLRDQTLGKIGYKVLRFSNYEIHNNFKGVCETIQSALDNALGNVP